MRKIALPILVCLLFSGLTFAQTLAVRDIMAEPSIAGMRAEGEKLSPDGSKVVFLWNTEGKLPLDIYISPTTHGAPVRLLGPRDLPPPPARTETESKLTYGLTVRDDFTKARENAISSLEWSADSKKLLFTYAGDLYVLDASLLTPEKRWRDYEAALLRMADLIPAVIKAVRSAGVEESGLFAEVADARADLLNKMLEPPAGNYGAKSPEQKKALIESSEKLIKILDRVDRLPETYPVLKSGTDVLAPLEELQGTENRVNVYRMDYEDSARMKSPKRLTKTQSAEVAARFLDNDRVLFQQNGNIFVLDTLNSTLTQISKEANPQAFISIGNVNPNKTGSLVAYVVSDGSKQKALFVPNYLDDFVAAPSVRRGWSEQKVMVMPSDGSRDTPFEIKLPKAEGTSYLRAIRWAAGGSSLVIDRNDKDTRRRQLFYVHNVGSKAEQIILLTEETDDKWIAPLSAIVEPDPRDPGQILFGSEKGGFNHLYLANLEKNKPEPNPAGEIRQENPTDPGYTSNVQIKQLTSGDWQVEWAKWAPEGGYIIYLSTANGTAGREFFTLRPDNGRPMPVPANDKGMKTGAQLSEKGDQPILLYESSKWNQPGDLYAVDICVKCRGLTYPERIGKTVPDSFAKIKWNEPKFVDIPSRDNKKIPAKIYFPEGFNKAKKYPMVIFVHGAGYLQNVIDGWNNYYREFMFNDLLTRKGYLVLDIDYRGSAGYGRDWRTDVYDFLGGRDMDDHLDAIDYMVANYSVNQSKIGVYGGSYGGFMAEMLAMRAPERIAAAAALRPVADWKNYYASSPVYTAQRLGFPDKNPEGYKRSSPISYAEKLERPLLILHGMVDDNVPAQDSMQLIEKLIRLGKTQYFESMLYPSENHGFTRPSSWTDEYERILAFFEKHLK